MSLGNNIIKRRKAKNLTQEALAKMVGVNQSFIAQLERGSKVPTIPLGKAIAEVLGCTLDELADDGDNTVN